MEQETQDHAANRSGFAPDPVPASAPYKSPPAAPAWSQTLSKQRSSFGLVRTHRFRDARFTRIGAANFVLLLLFRFQQPKGYRAAAGSLSELTAGGELCLPVRRPALAKNGLEILVRLGVVGDPHLGGIPLELAFHAQSDHAQQHPLDEWTGHAEIRADRKS